MYCEELIKAREAIEYKKACEEYARLLKLTGGSDIIKEWDEDAHPRGEDGRFVSAGGGTDKPTDSSGNPYTRPTLYLSKKEYGKVTRSINNVYATRYKGKTRGNITMAGKNGYTTYYFEVHDYNEYNIYGKETQ